MKERKRRDFTREPTLAASASKGGKGSSRLFLLFAICFSVLLLTIGLSHIRLYEVFHPVLLSAWPITESRLIFTDPSNPYPYSRNSNPTYIKVNHAVLLPDEIVLVTNHHSLLSIPNPDLLKCQYTPPASSHSSRHSLSAKAKLNLPPLSLSTSLVRCPLGPPGFSLSLSTSPHSRHRPFQWDHLAYSALFDPLDNSTVVFAKGFNLRSARISDPAQYRCVFRRDLSNPKYIITSPVITAAQEIFRCKTPLTVLNSYRKKLDMPLVSVKTKDRGAIALPSVARPEILKRYRRNHKKKKKHSMCICTMVRNQARFLREWIMYHSKVGVQRWLIYDNNSEDKIEQAVNSLGQSNYNITLHPWPWIKTQEAGFAHCALRARADCEWVGFIDVDEFFYFPYGLTIRDVLKNYSNQPWVGELRTDCHNFGPSGHKKAPENGVTTGYTCRMLAPERHKSIIRPEALNKSLINVVHHFHLREGMRSVNVGQGVMLINHYKYQAWEVFKEKFKRRVATYVADWQDEENVGSKDRAPGLGTKPVEPPDWPYRFCELNDTGLRDWVIKEFKDPQTGELSW
ncbi:Glycosyltransferase family 92 protein [Rhynchospora pubera]|uniref:Glycosyltransferase family 92 protein n=1 Tax=Rhynchospora pubera TaxID=906938 RepID=A0AAV8F4R9_9POAL|nr:Glycosyltransferase family 92 protein [Rhynchospora pubera]